MLQKGSEDTVPLGSVFEKKGQLQDCKNSTTLQPLLFISSLLQINHPMSMAASRTQELQHVHRRRWLCDVGRMMTGRVPTECSAALGHGNYVQKDVPISLLLKVNLPSFLVKSLINFKPPFLSCLNQLNSPRIPTKS